MKRIVPYFFLAAITFAVYAPALRNGFVWDDTALILRDPLIRSWRLIPEGFQHFLFIDATASDFFRPIQRLTYTLDYAAFGFAPSGYHFTSIAWHIAATLAFLLLGQELLSLFGMEEKKRRCVAFLAALAWGIHPLATSAVVYVSGRADPLMATFGFLGLFYGIRSLQAAGLRRWSLLVATGTLFLLSALSKEAGLIFPLLWGAILIAQKRWHQLLPATVAALFILATYFSLRLGAEHIPPPTLHPPPPMLVRPIIAARAVAEYFGIILLPTNLHMERNVETQPKGVGVSRADWAARRELQTLLGVILIGGMIYWFVRSRRVNPDTACTLLLALIAYLPISGAFPLNATVAEHWLYLPTAFLFLAGMLTITRLNLPGALVGTVLVIWFGFLGARTWIRTFDWRDQRTFIERTIAHGGDTPRMWINLATVETSEGHLDSAKEALNRALGQEPDQPLAIVHLASIALRQGDFNTARELLNRAVNMPLVNARAYELLAMVDQKEKGELNLLKLHLATQTGPPNWSIERRYLQALNQGGATTRAIDELRSMLVTQWYRAESWQLLSDLLKQTGQSKEAADALARARAYDVRLDEHLSP